MKRIFYSLFLLLGCYAICFAGEMIYINVDGVDVYEGEVFLTKGPHTIYSWSTHDSEGTCKAYKDVCTRKNPWKTGDPIWYGPIAELGSYGQMIADIDGYYQIFDGYYPESNSFVIYPEISGSCGENLTWAFDTVSENLAIYGSGTMTSHPWENISPALIKSITLPPALTSICDSAFLECSSLTSITIPNRVTSIGDKAFYGCSSLTSVTIPNSVTSIGDKAFYGCSSLASITCEATTPPTLGTSVFYGTKLSAVYIPGNTLSAYQTAWGNEYVFINNENTLTLHVATPGTLSELIFDAGKRPVLVAKLTLTGTLNDADFTCMRETMTSLVDVDLSGITNTSGVYFAGKKNLLRIILPTNLTSIGEWAFSGCSSLTSVTIPNSVTTVGGAMFYGCSQLKSVVLSNNITSLPHYYDGAERTYGFFENCSSLTSVTIPNSVTSIGRSAFAGCSALTKTNYTGDIAGWCDIKFGGSNANPMCYSHNFYINDQEIKDLVIPNTVDSIHDYAFSGCSSLTSVTIPNSVTSIGNSAFWSCSSLTSVTIPNSVTSIGGAAFSYCSSLTSITIPNSVTSIGGMAFESCSSLTSVTIPNSVTSIGYNAFSYCSSLTSITCLGTTPPEASNLGANTSTCKLIVPHSAYNAYIRHAYWGQFLNIVAGFWVVILNTNNNQWGEVAGGGMYTDNTTITITATPYNGYSFLRWSDGNTDNPRTLTVTEDITLTAEFVEYRDMTIIFTNSEDNDSEIYSQSLTLTIPAAPEIEGFTFLYWQPVAEPLTDVITIQAIYKSDIPTANEVYVNPANPAQKLLRNGQVYILQDGETYTIQGHKL